MEQVTLKSKYGSTGFRARTMLQHPDSGKNYYENVKYEFNWENGLKATVPKQLWNSLEDKYFDTTLGLKYSEAFQTL